MSTFQPLEYLLWGAVRIYTDHLNLAHIFEPKVCVSSMPKTAARRLGNWKMGLAQYYTIMHISGERNYCGNFLSRWAYVLAVALRAVAAFVSSAPDDIIPSKSALREVQQQARAGLSAKISGAFSFTTSVGSATKDNEELFRVGLDG